MVQIITPLPVTAHAGGLERKTASCFERMAKERLSCPPSPADHLGHEALESRGGNAMVRFVHSRIGIQSRIYHDPVDEVVYHGSDAINST